LYVCECNCYCVKRQDSMLTQKLLNLQFYSVHVCTCTFLHKQYLFSFLIKVNQN
jgi:hypothetical protein